MVSDVVIVGAGAIGGAVALALAERGVKVTVVEGARAGRGASWAAAGVLAPDWSGHDPPALTTLALASLALWPEWAEIVQERSGVPLNYRRDGLLNLQVDPDAPRLPHELGLRKPALECGEWLSASEVHALEPMITGPILGGVIDREVVQIDNPRLTPALVRAGSGWGVRFREGVPVTGLMRSAGRCAGVRLADGSELAAGAVVLAAGAWSAPLAASSGIELPMEPWRGQMLAFDTVARPLGHIVLCGELVLVPRPHGPLVVGTTFERVGFDARVTLAGLTHILARADRIAPGLGDLPLSRTWASLRPGTPDGLPYLGPIPGWDNLYAATGHGRKGLILAPLTGDIMARLVLDGALDPRAIPCLPSRAIAE
jgi:glycine oxidase